LSEGNCFLENPRKAGFSIKAEVSMSQWYQSGVSMPLKSSREVSTLINIHCHVAVNPQKPVLAGIAAVVMSPLTLTQNVAKHGYA
jgi:hypothetical protein